MLVVLRTTRRGVTSTVLHQRGKTQSRSLVHVTHRRSKADVHGDIEKTLAVHEERFRSLDFGKRFDDFGKRFDDLVNRVASNERTSLAFLGLGIGCIYYTGTKIDKQSADLNAKIDEQRSEIHEINLKISKLVADKSK